MMFSIGIPAYKSSFLKECIDSILLQTIFDFELIIVNDASPENIEEIVKSYSDTRIKYFKNKKNIGAENLVDNWNICLSYAQGEYFVLMGDDDRLEPNYLEEFVSLIERYPDLDVYHCRSKIINDKSDIIGLTPSWPEFESVYECIWHRTQTKRIQFISDFIYRTEVLKNNEGFYKLPLAWGSDDITSFIAMVDKGIAHTNKPVFNYRRNSQTISVSGSIQLKMQAIMLKKEWYMIFLNDSPICIIDKILHQNSVGGMNKYIQKQKIDTIVKSYNRGFLIRFCYWLLMRKSFQIKTSEVIYSVIEYFKQKKSQINY